MSYQVLARKWRPRSFAEVTGQEHVLKALSNALDSGRIHHAYLFTGTRGVGKTTLGRIVARALNCESGVSSTPCGECSSCREIDEGRFPDLIEVDAASRTKVDETRELLDNVQYAPTRGRFKVYLIDEVHMFSNHSFNALLKTLEEPPPHVKFLLATTDPKKLPVTILSRCLQFNLTRMTVDQLSSHIAGILDAEQIDYEAEALSLLARAAGGSVRDALSLVDQAIAYAGGKLAAPAMIDMLGVVGSEKLIAIIENVVNGNALAMIQHAREFAERSPDYDAVFGELLSLLRRIAVWQAIREQPGELSEEDAIVKLSSAMSPEDCQLLYQLALIGRRDLNLAPDPEIGFEMALLRMLAFQPQESGQSVARIAPATSAPNVESPNGSSMPAPAASKTAAAPPTISNERAPTTAQREKIEEPPPISDSDIAAHQGDAQGAIPEDLAGRWPEVIDALNLIGLTREFARNSAVSKCQGDHITLLVQPQFEKLAAKKNIAALRAALSRSWNLELKLEVELAQDNALSTPSDLDRAAAAEKQKQAEQAIDNDSNIQAIRDAFGATIEEVSAQ